VRFIADTITLGHGFIGVLRGFPCQYYSTNAPYTSSPTSNSWQKDRWAKPGNLPRSNALFEIEVHSIEGGLGNFFAIKGF
jgi:hypothetical protein